MPVQCGAFDYLPHSHTHYIQLELEFLPLAPIARYYYYLISFSSKGKHKFPSIFIILLTLLSPIASKSLLNFIYYCCANARAYAKRSINVIVCALAGDSTSAHNTRTEWRQALTNSREENSPAFFSVLLVMCTRLSCAGPQSPSIFF